MNEPTEYFLVREKQYQGVLPNITTHRRSGSNCDNINLANYRQIPSMDKGMDRFVHKDDYAEYCQRMGFTHKELQF